MTLSRLLRHLHNTQGHTYFWLPFESVFFIRMRIDVPVHVMMWRLPSGVLVLYMWRRRHWCGQLLGERDGRVVETKLEVIT